MNEIVNISLGSDLKINIHVEPINGLSMQDYDFSVDVYTRGGKVLKFDKWQCIKADADNYRITFNTQDLGIGTLKYKFAAYIPDSDFDDGVRTEIAFGRMNINIVAEV